MQIQKSKFICSKSKLSFADFLHLAAGANRILAKGRGKN
jgi:hypothetical protein